MWANESKFDTEIGQAAAAYGLPVPLLKGIIGTESGFRAEARRAEATDVSVGLGQLLTRVARLLGYGGDVGSPVDLSGLYDPKTYIELTADLLSQNLSRTRTIRGAVSAYNGGLRKAYGFGWPVETVTNVCLARDRSGKCVESFTAQPGQYGNQPYVDKVMAAFRYFGGTT